jgi:hypothetical protein
VSCVWSNDLEVFGYVRIETFGLFIFSYTCTILSYNVSNFFLLDMISIADRAPYTTSSFHSGSETLNVGIMQAFIHLGSVRIPL